jgi:putative aldouronate transport system permease protein
MREYNTPLKVLTDILIYLLAGLLCVICILPVIHTIMASFSDPLKLEAHKGLLLWPLEPTIKGYQLVWSIPSVKTGYMNTIFVVIFGTTFNMLMTCLGAWVLAQKHWWYSRFMMVLVTITMYFGGGLVPSYLLVKDLGLLDSRLALIIPSAISVWNMIVMRTGFMSVPDSLSESAKLDGASDLTILVRIIIPLSKAVLAVILLYYAVGHWNSWFSAMIYIRSRDKYPLQLVLREVLVLDSNSASVGGAAAVLDSVNVDNMSKYRRLVRYTTIVIATVPVLCFYPFIQKYFTKGVMIGSLKG